MPVLFSLLVLAAVSDVSMTPKAASPNQRTLSFTDKQGEHRVRFTFTDAEKGDERSRRMKVLHEQRASAKAAWKKVWEAKDFVEACPLDLELELLERSVVVTDLDDDGEAEVSFAYTLGCFSDVSPRTMKLLMYEGKTKYALRGNTKFVDSSGSYGGELLADPSFTKAPRAFLEAARENWETVLPVVKVEPSGPESN